MNPRGTEIETELPTKELRSAYAAAHIIANITHTGLLVIGIYGLRGLGTYAKTPEALHQTANGALHAAIAMGIILGTVLSIIGRHRITGNWLQMAATSSVITLSMIGIGAGYVTGHIDIRLVLTIGTTHLLAETTQASVQKILAKRNLPARNGRYRKVPTEPPPAWYGYYGSSLLAETFMRISGTWVVLNGAIGFTAMNHTDGSWSGTHVAAGLAILLASYKLTRRPEHSFESAGTERTSTACLLAVAVAVGTGAGYAVAAGLTNATSFVTATIIASTTALARAVCQSKQRQIAERENTSEPRIWYESEVAEAVAAIAGDPNPDRYNLDAIYDEAYEPDPHQYLKIRPKAELSGDDVERTIHRHKLI